MAAVAALHNVGLFYLSENGGSIGKPMNPVWPPFLVLAAFYAQEAASTPPCRSPTEGFDGIAPPSSDPLPTNAHFLLGLADAVPPVSLQIDGVDLAFNRLDHESFVEIVPTAPLPPGAEVELRAGDNVRLTYSVGAQQLVEPPEPPIVAELRPETLSYCRPATAVALQDPGGFALVLGRFDEPPTVDESGPIAGEWGTLLVLGDPATTRTLFLVAVDAAGNRSQPTPVEITFQEVPTPPLSCAHRTSQPSSPSVPIALTLLGAAHLNRAIRRRKRVRAPREESRAARGKGARAVKLQASLMLFLAASTLGCDPADHADAGPRAAEEGDAGNDERVDGGMDAGPSCGGNCPPPPCPQPAGIGLPCCDVDGNVVGEFGCFEDAGVICSGGDLGNCP